MNKNHTLFNVFVRQYHVRLRAFIRSLGVNSCAVDDIAQETFLLAYHKLDSFDAELDFGSWLFGIARNLVRNELRKQARQQRIMNEKLSHHLINEAENNTNINEVCGEELSVLNMCIDQLPETSKQILMVKYYDEQDTSMLAKQFKMTSNALRIALTRIRKKLRSCMENKL